MPFKMLVSCENRNRVQLPTPFTCLGKLKMSFVQKILIFVFCVFKLFSVFTCSICCSNASPLGRCRLTYLFIKQYVSKLRAQDNIETIAK